MYSSSVNEEYKRNVYWSVLKLRIYTLLAACVICISMSTKYCLLLPVKLAAHKITGFLLQMHRLLRESFGEYGCCPPGY